MHQMAGIFVVVLLVRHARVVPQLTKRSYSFWQETGNLSGQGRCLEARLKL